MENWPTSLLPDASLDFGGDNEPSTTRTEMDSGRTVQRRRFTADMKSNKAKWSFTADQFAIFQSWVFNKINAGADFFNADLTIGDVIQTYKVRLVDGKYSYRLNHPRWEVTAVLEIEDPDYLPMDDLDALLDIGNLDLLEQAVEDFHTLIHVYLPTPGLFGAIESFHSTIHETLPANN